MTKYLGDMEEEDLILFVLEHLKDHKAPHKLVEGLEPVRLFSVSQQVFSLPSLSKRIGSGRRGPRICRQPLATNHLREHGIQRRHLNREDACG